MEVLNFKLNDGEKASLKKDAHLHEMNVSEYLRWLIKKEHDRVLKIQDSKKAAD